MQTSILGFLHPIIFHQVSTQLGCLNCHSLKYYCSKYQCLKTTCMVFIHRKKGSNQQEIKFLSIASNSCSIYIYICKFSSMYDSSILICHHCVIKHISLKKCLPLSINVQLQWCKALCSMVYILTKCTPTFLLLFVLLILMS